MLRAQT